VVNASRHKKVTHTMGSVIEQEIQLAHKTRDRENIKPLVHNPEMYITNGIYTYACIYTYGNGLGSNSN